MAASIGQWLEGLGLGQYARAFAENAIEPELLRTLTDDDLRELGVAALGHRKRILAAIREAQGVTPDADAPAGLDGDGSLGTPATDAERRHVTVLFCDLVGSTALSARLDPEDLREVLRSYQDVCARVIARYDGYLAKFMGDGVFAYFGYPRGHEDDAERAVNAGLSLVESVAALSSDLAVRVGIATGTVVVGDLLGEGTAEEAAITGEAPNLAGRLQGLAEPNSVVIADATHRLAAGFFETEDLGRHDLKGFAEPVRVWAVRGHGRAETRFEGTRADELTALIGRDEEMEILLRRWQRAKAGEGQVVLISGEPGIGKSRLAREVEARIAGEPHVRLTCQCSPYHTTSALHPVIERLTRAAGFETGESADERLDKLDAMLAPSGRPLEQVVPLYAALLSVPTGERYPELQMPPPVRKQLTLTALAGQVAGMAAHKPLLFVLEDAHWVDPTTLELLELLVEQTPDLATLMLITYRPEFEAPWADRPRVTPMLLGRLESADCASMIAGVERSGELTDALRSRIAARADGVPLFVEELTKSVLELAGESLDRLASIEVPTSLKDSLEARLDQLGPAKELAQIGSVIGRSFDFALLSDGARLADDELRQRLDRLVGSGLVTRRGEPPEATYTFKHALVLDTAYDTLLRGRRAELHRRIGEAIETRSPETAETEPEILARHFAEAGAVEKAAEYWMKAGRASAQRSSFAEAIAQIENGLALVDKIADEKTRHRIELGFRAILAPAIRAIKGFAHVDAEKAYEEAFALCRGDADSPYTFPLLWGLWHIRWSQGHMRPAVGHAEELLAAAEASQRSDHLLIAHCSLAIALWFAGDNPRAVHHTEQAFPFYDRDQHASLSSSYFYEFGTFRLILRGVQRFCLGYPDTAVAALGEAIDFARGLGQPHMIGFAWSALAQVLVFRHDPAAALKTSEEAVAEMGAAATPTPFAIIIGCLRSWANALSGDVDDGLRQLRHWTELWVQTGAEYFLPLYRAMDAEVCLAASRPDEALQIAEEELTRLDGTGQNQWRSMLLWTKGDALLARAALDPAEAERCYVQAIDVARAQSAKSWELRAALRLARLWRSQNRPDEARGIVAPIYGWFTEGFDTPDLIEAKALLEELS